MQLEAMAVGRCGGKGTMAKPGHWAVAPCSGARRKARGMVDSLDQYML